MKKELKPINPMKCENLEMELDEKTMGKAIMYTPSITTHCCAMGHLNPFTSVVSENFKVFAIVNANYKNSANQDLARDIAVSVSSYIANSVSMNVVSIFEDPWNNGFIHAIKPYINSKEEFNHDFYTTYNNFIYHCCSVIESMVYSTIWDYFVEKYEVGKHQYKRGIEVKPNEIVSFMSLLKYRISDIYTNEGQKFIIDIITKNSIDVPRLNDYVVKPMTKAMGLDDVPDEKSFSVIRNDPSQAIIYLNAALKQDLLKISEITEPIIFSGIYYINEMSRSVTKED